MGKPASAKSRETLSKILPLGISTRNVSLIRAPKKSRELLRKTEKSTAALPFSVLSGQRTVAASKNDGDDVLPHKPISLFYGTQARK
jgi:hypothetical protein